jgi:hypothetical protein
MDLLQTYLESLNVIHSSGSAVKETSYYGTLESLLNEVGKALKPRVRCVINIANRGAGLPDGGLFTPDQFQKRAKGELIEGQLPSRGCIEIKSTSDEVDVIVDSEHNWANRTVKPVHCLTDPRARTLRVCRLAARPRP